MKKNKKISALMLAVAFVMTTFASIVPAQAAQQKELIVLHDNDVHSRVAGEPYLSAYRKSLLKDNKNVLLLSAGDMLHGQPFATIARGSSIVEVMNEVGYDAMVPGNHDFNYGFDHLKELEKDMKFSLISANVVYKDTKKPAFTQYIIKEIDGVKVGIFGLSTPETATKTNPKNVEKVEFTDPVKAAEDMVTQLKKEGATVIIALSHLGLDEETLPAERSTAIAAVEGIDLIVDGHSHTELPTGQKEGNSLIVQTGEYLKNFGEVTMEIDASTKKVTKESAKLIALTEDSMKTMATDQTVVDTIKKIETENEKLTSQVIGKTPVTLDGEREDVRVHETNLSNLLSDAMLETTGADVAISNGGGIRASIAAGNITKGDILTVLPFGNFICTVKVSGQDIIDAIEHGLDSYPEPAGHFAQIGGMTITFDSTQPAGQRVTEIHMRDGSLINKTKEYVVVTNDFMAAGGDGYTMFASNKAYMEFGALDEALIDYIASGVDIAKIDTNRYQDKKRATTVESVQDDTVEEGAIEHSLLVA